MARILPSLDIAPLCEPFTEHPAANSPISDGRIDSLVAGASLPTQDEPMPDHLIQLALKLAQALDTEG